VRRLIDTSVLIDHLRGVAEAHAFLRDAVTAGDELWSVTVVRTEVLAGMRPGEERPTHALLGLLQWLPVDVDLADEAAALARRWLRSHRAIDTVDYLVAAATDRLGARLETLNVRHFPMFAPLHPAYAIG
jgi:predicted nucleic acid-binding protein